MRACVFSGRGAHAFLFVFSGRGARAFLSVLFHRHVRRALVEEMRARVFSGCAARVSVFVLFFRFFFGPRGARANTFPYIFIQILLVTIQQFIHLIQEN